MLTRTEYETREAEILAPFAVKSRETQGRAHPEEEHPYRPVFQRDRGRIVHSTAFRRLEYKTQVFVNHEGDYYRTRLTHTNEVSQIARSLARTLRLNEDLSEAIALAHDIGHTPFGHSGEAALHELMKDHGGFEHNAQGLRVVDYLEERYAGFRGLNLSWEVREGIGKHRTDYDQGEVPEFDPREGSSLESQVVDVADEIAYTSHDVDDGLAAGLLSEGSLKEIGLWCEVEEKVTGLSPQLDPERRRKQTIRLLIDALVTDVLQQTEKTLEERGSDSPAAVRREGRGLVTFSAGMQPRNQELKQFLLDKFYHHPRVLRMAEKARRFVTELFHAYQDHPHLLPPHVEKRIAQDGKERVVCDYVAGMTDRFALDEYRKLFLPYERS